MSANVKCLLMSNTRHRHLNKRIISAIDSELRHCDNVKVKVKVNSNIKLKLMRESGEFSAISPFFCTEASSFVFGLDDASFELIFYCF